MSERVTPRPSAAGTGEKKTGSFAGLFQTGGFDVPFVFLVMFLFAVGITMMYSASYPYATVHGEHGANTFFFNQLKWGLAGFAAMLLISKVNYRVLNSSLAPGAFGLAVAVLLFTYFWNIWQHNEIKRWLKLPGLPQVQPSEFAKFVLILTLSYVICILYRTLNVPARGHRVRPNIARLPAFEKRLFDYGDT